MWIWTEFTDKHTLWSHSMNTLLHKAEFGTCILTLKWFRIFREIKALICTMIFHETFWETLTLWVMTVDSRSPLDIDKANAWRLPAYEWWGVTHVFIIKFTQQPCATIQRCRCCGTVHSTVNIWKYSLWISLAKSPFVIKWFFSGSNLWREKFDTLSKLWVLSPESDFY